MDRSRVDIVWPAATGEPSPRHLFIHDELRYAKRSNQIDVDHDGFLNYHWLHEPGGSRTPDGHARGRHQRSSRGGRPRRQRRALIAIRSSPWKAGHESNPWHDEFDLDHGHVRYFGDHKPGTVGLPGATKGNSLLLEAARLHAGTTSRGAPARPASALVPQPHRPPGGPRHREGPCRVLRSGDHRTPGARGSARSRVRPELSEPVPRPGRCVWRRDRRHRSQVDR